MKNNRVLIITLILIGVISIFSSAKPAIAEEKKSFHPRRSLSISKEDDRFYSYLFAFCGTITILDTEKEFKQRIISKMEEFSPSGNINRYWLEIGCTTR